ncbi:EF-P 5-aminopentanol modification-associated protein YfmF [Paenibacillus sp. 1001270B_150601_E10]|uniref:EF-P 5-aminopentanol modification-associated protein YfmF n=1 Tax=Paenibacillus sp. 1001270B_150601_E10 TaxID=2787079 RepID=UPI00189E13FD
MPTQRFKTFAIAVYIGFPLKEETVTPLALTPFVLRRGTTNFPETIQFRERLDELYGAGFGFDVYKRGDYQIVQFRMDIINDAFVHTSESLLKRGFQFLGDVITSPALEDGVFRSKYVQEEKETVRKRLEAIVNDKIRYAQERCVEEMCKDEPYRLHPLGDREALANIDANSLYQQYESWLDQACIDVYVIGDTSLDEIEQCVTSSFQVKRTKESAYTQAKNQVRSGEPQQVVDRLDVSQGKLNLGLRTTITYQDDEYPAALLYNGVLGGYPHSKLFINVREKNSLAYYASSRYDGHKGIMTVQSGVEFNLMQKATEIIKEQLQAMEQGNIETLELAQTKAMISNHLREINDSAFEMIGFDFNRVLSGRERTTSALIEEVADLTVEDIQNAARTFRLDTIYELRNREEV